MPTQFLLVLMPNTITLTELSKEPELSQAEYLIRSILSLILEIP